MKKTKNHRWKKNTLAWAITLTAGAVLTQTTPVFADKGHDHAKGKCWGVNSCKGKTACATAHNSCAGKNACKGKGWMKMSKEDCEKQHGKWEKMKKKG